MSLQSYIEIYEKAHAAFLQHAFLQIGNKDAAFDLAIQARNAAIEAVIEAVREGSG